MNHQLFARFCIILAVLAVLARAMIPVGYMPKIGHDSFQMVICTIDGSKTITVDGDFDPQTDKAPHEKSNHCDFSLVKNLSLQTPAFAIFSVLLFFSFLSFGFLSQPIRVTRLRNAVIQPRAPPRFI